MTQENFNGFGWEPTSQPLYLANGSEVKSHKAIVNGKTGESIFVMGKRYSILSNTDLTSQANLLAEVAQTEVEGFETYDGGRKVLAILKNPHEGIEIAGHEMKSKIILGNSFDGSKPIFLGTSDEYIRCKNQFGRIMKAFSIRHSKDQVGKLAAMVEMARVYFEEHTKMLNTFEKMSKVQIDQKVYDALIRDYFDIDSTIALNDTEAISTRKLNLIDTFKGSLDREINELGGNVWGLFNGVTYHNTHVAKQKDRDSVGLFGLTAKNNLKAFDFLSNVMEVGLAV